MQNDVKRTDQGIHTKQQQTYVLNEFSGHAPF